jgi:hypothetical protein
MKMANKIALIFHLLLKRKYDVLEAVIRMGDRLAGVITCCSEAFAAIHSLIIP